MSFMAQLELAPGLELGGSVRLQKKLGEGGMGSVWVAEHLALRTQVAVKFLAAHMVADPSAAARFRREATAAARIKSPHVVQIFDHDMSERLGPYIVMELLDGETLSDYVRRHGQLTPRQTLEILTQLGKALGKAHALGIVHRDIKPDNVFLIDSQHDIFIKVLDFGIAKSDGDQLTMTSTGTMMGTPHYMSPEQMLSSKHVDFRADLWATAVLSYHCLTGGVPFDGETFGAIAIAVAQGSFAPPFQLRGVGSLALDAWFVRALARDPQHRFQSAAELAESFGAAIAMQPLASGLAPGTLNVASPSAVTAVEGSLAVTAPTFTGVATTMARPSSSKTIALGAIAAGLLLGGGALALALVSHGAPAPEPSTHVAASAAPTAVAEPSHPAPAVSEAPSVTSAPSTPSATPSVEAPKPAPARVVLPTKPKPTKPVTPDATARSARPDRGF